MVRQRTPGVFGFRCVRISSDRPVRVRSLSNLDHVTLPVFTMQNRKFVASWRCVESHVRVLQRHSTTVWCFSAMTFPQLTFEKGHVNLWVRRSRRYSCAIFTRISMTTAASVWRQVVLRRQAYVHIFIVQRSAFRVHSLLLYSEATV